MAKIKVGVNGYGVIGKRIADAINIQDDMDLVGVADVSIDYRIQLAKMKGYDIYSSTTEAVIPMKQSGIGVKGILYDLLEKVDVIIDATPKGVGVKNKTAYEKAGVKAVFQGGEKHEVTGFSFNAQSNYKNAFDKQMARVVSCNTTGLLRTFGSLHQKGWVKKARAILFRRATDPWESHKEGMINTVLPEVDTPSHQTPDAQSVIPGLNLVSVAAEGPFNLGHIHFAMVELSEDLKREDIIDHYWETPRISFVSSKSGIEAMNSVYELMREIARPRGDMWEVPIWMESINVTEGEMLLIYQVHNEAIVIPENVDVVRALMKTEEDPMVSIKKTDESLGIVKEYLPGISKISRKAA